MGEVTPYFPSQRFDCNDDGLLDFEEFLMATSAKEEEKEKEKEEKLEWLFDHVYDKVIRGFAYGVYW